MFDEVEDKTKLAPFYGSQCIFCVLLCYYLRQGGYVFVAVYLFVCCLFVSNFAQKLPNGFAWNFQGRLEWTNEQMIKFWWRSGSRSGYSDCFLDSSLLGDTESDINRLRCATLRCRHALAGIAIATMTSLRHRSTTDSHDRRALAEICTAPVVIL